MTSAFAHLGTIRTAEAGPRAPREFSALGRAVDWINSLPLACMPPLPGWRSINGRRQFEIEFLDVGVESFAFTFG